MRRTVWIVVLVVACVLAGCSENRTPSIEAHITYSDESAIDSRSVSEPAHGSSEAQTLLKEFVGQGVGTQRSAGRFTVRNIGADTWERASFNVSSDYPRSGALYAYIGPPVGLDPNETVILPATAFVLLDENGRPAYEFMGIRDAPGILGERAHNNLEWNPGFQGKPLLFTVLLYTYAMDPEPFTAKVVGSAEFGVETIPWP